MVVRETSNGQWVRINVNPDVPAVYFGDRFLKASRKKSDTTPVFTAPTKPLTFGLVFNADVWAKIQALDDMEVRDHSLLGPNKTNVLLHHSSIRGTTKWLVHGIQQVQST